MAEQTGQALPYERRERPAQLAHQVKGCLAGLAVDQLDEHPALAHGQVLHLLLELGAQFGLGKFQVQVLIALPLDLCQIVLILPQQFAGDARIGIHPDDVARQLVVPGRFAPVAWAPTGLHPGLGQLHQGDRIAIDHVGLQHMKAAVRLGEHAAGPKAQYDTSYQVKGTKVHSYGRWDREGTTPIARRYSLQRISAALVSRHLLRWHRSR
jgi:hypothetical protein